MTINSPTPILKCDEFKWAQAVALRVQGDQSAFMDVAFMVRKIPSMMTNGDITSKNVSLKGLFTSYLEMLGHYTRYYIFITLRYILIFF